MSPQRPDLDGLDQEMRDHIEAETEDNIARGMSREDAHYAARRKFGNPARVKEDVRAVWIPGWIDRLRQDARDAVRHVRRNPGFSFAIIVTLALGIGLTTAIYSVINAVLLRPLAYQHPDRMVWLTTVGKSAGPEIMNSIDFETWQSQSTSLAHMIAYEYADATLVAGGEASRLRIVAASDGFWQVSGAQPLLGALPTSKEPDVLALAHRVFREQFQSDPQIIGRAVTVDGRQMTIGAVLAADFQPQLVGEQWWLKLGERVDAAAYRMRPVEPAPRVIDPSTAVRIYQVFGEVKPGVSIEQARAEIDAIHTRAQRERPSPFGASTAVVVPMQEKIVGPSRLALGVLLSASIVVLLITCANVANLLLSRSAARRKEIALRMSVGSGPMRVVRQLLAESLGYALLGGIGGVLLASWLINAVIGLIGPAMPRLIETRMDPGVMAVALAISIGTALLFGVGPAIALCFTNVQEVLKEGGRSVSASRRVLLAGRAMVVLQVALTVVLLAGAGLMLKSVWRMTSPPPGFAPEQLLTMRVDFRGPQFREQRARNDYAEALLARAKTLPGVRDAAVTSGRASMMMVVKEGESPREIDRDARGAPVSSISENFPRLLGMSLASGRWFEEVEAPESVLINETLARSVFDGNALGARIRLPWVGANGLGTIVGVVADLKYADIDADTKPELFFHHSGQRLFGVTMVMRIDGDPIAAAPAIRKALSAIDPTQSFYDIETMEQTLAESIAPRRFNLLLLGTFAIVALVLAVLGVFGVVSYAVAERTQEIGIRLALGAQRARVVRMIVAQGMASVIAGIVIGLVAAGMATRLIAGLLYGVEATDVPTFAVSTLLLTAVAFVACSAPALKAAVVDPVVALRAE
ncbi:MAG: ABC transporter permease [Vicinamibacterales bacterium]